ncbi:transporter substrate-binding domain-containing protein [Echinicola salinicaeni]|uniref:transporter substrate-binding domain-containing protein n=1 Tax=Echinicola salinicaeni TaxID=2762757 RepID=UPI0016447715
MKFLIAFFLILVAIFPSQAFEKDTLLVGYHVSPPFVMESNQGISGPSVWLWNKIAEENDIVFKYKKMELEQVLEGLSKNEIDLSLSPLTITSERTKTINFSSPYYIAHTSLMQKSQSALNQGLQFIGSIFNLNFLKAVGALALILFIFGALVWLFERKKNKDEFGDDYKGFWDGFWWAAVTMTTVGYGDKSPQTIGGRVIGLIWMFTAIIIISGFTAGIASSLTVNRMGSANNSIEDFKKEKIGTIKNSGTSHWLQYNFYSNRMEYDQMSNMLNALDNGEILAIAYDRPLLYKLIEDDSLSEKYTLLDTKYNPQFYAFGMSKTLDNGLKDQINISLLENTESIDYKVMLSENNLSN